MENLNNKVVLITGAGSGIGRATALEFARNGSDLILVGRNNSSIDSVKQEIIKMKRKVWVYRVDVSDFGQVKNLAERVFSEIGHIDVLVNNAGVGISSEFSDIDISDWYWIMGVNFWGIIYMTYVFLPYMKKKGNGHIVNISSTAGLIALPVQSAYCASKFAVVGISESLRVELAKYNIGVTTICPGVVRTPIFKSIKIKGFTRNITNTPKFISTTPEKAAEIIVKAVRKNKRLVVITWFAKLGYAIKRVSPHLSDIIGKIYFRLIDKHRIKVKGI